MLVSAIICYIISIMIVTASAMLSVFFLKKRGIDFSFFHSVIGALSAVIVIMAMVAVIMFAFSEESTAYMSALMPEWIYKTAVAFILLIAMLAIRFFIVNGLYFSKYKDDKGMSFLTGYGLIPVVLAGAYCVLILIAILINVFQGGFMGITEQSVMKFANDSVISVFTPFYAHICISVDLASYCVLIHAVSAFMHKYSLHSYSTKSTVLMFLLLSVCEGIMLYAILFFASKVNTILLSALFVLLAVISVILVKFLYRYKEESVYNKQFEV